MRVRIVPLIILVVLFGCDESGTDPVKPGEAHFRVLTATDTPFRVIGFLTSNGPPHLFDAPGREFAGPYSFYFENVERPLSGTFAGAPGALEDARVQLQFAFEEADGTFTDQAILPAGSSDQQTVSSQDGDPQPLQSASEIRVEVVEVDNALEVLFTTTIGDVDSTFVACGNSGVCRTPAIFYLEAPRDAVSAIISKLVKDDQELLVSLFLNGVLRDTDRATRDDLNAQVRVDL